MYDVKKEKLETVQKLNDACLPNLLTLCVKLISAELIYIF